MNTGKTLRLISATILGILATTTFASAADIAAIATGNVNVRTGPSTAYTRVDTLQRGEYVTVKQCQNGWCYVDHRGPDGWVSANYLANARNGQNNNATPRPQVNFGLTFGGGSGGPSFSFSIGNSPRHTAPPAPSSTPQVCFFKGNHYTGSNFCVTPGTTDHQITNSWNNKISSVQVYGGAHVRLCQNWNFSGACVSYNSHVPVLPWQMNNKASSYHTWY